jgi:hypothetical protein
MPCGWLLRLFGCAFCASREAQRGRPIRLRLEAPPIQTEVGCAGWSASPDEGCRSCVDVVIYIDAPSIRIDINTTRMNIATIAIRSFVHQGKPEICAS